MSSRFRTTIASEWIFNWAYSIADVYGYLALSADVQMTWADAYYKLLAYPQTPRADQFAPSLRVACKAATSSSTIDNAGKQVEIYLLNHGAVSGENDVAAYLQGDSVAVPTPKQAVIIDSWTGGVTGVLCVAVHAGH